MAENLFSTFSIGGQGMSVQRMRLAAVAKNIANANNTNAIDGQTYQREIVVVNSVNQNSFNNELKTQLALSAEHLPTPSQDNNNNKIIDAKIAKDTSQPRLIYDPSHPDADDDGYVHMPNINIVTEMVEMISAQRAFEANTGVVEAAKNIARDSLEI